MNDQYSRSGFVKVETDLSVYNNDWYKKTIGASVLKQILWYCVNIVFIKNSLNPLSNFKVFILRVFGATIGKKVVIKPGVSIKYPWKLTIGDYSWIGEKVWIDNLADVKIGKHVCISQGAMLLTGNHDYTRPAFKLMVKGIELQNGAWIGAKAMVCPGVCCHSHAVLTAASVATGNLEPYTIYQGNPAHPVRERIIVQEK